jgi:hypothetical protein
MKRRGFLALLALLPGLSALSGKSARAAGVPVPVPELSAPQGPLNVFHLGHSLVGPDMPHMLAQLAGPGHRWNSQLGSGTSLKAHWQPGLEILDFERVNTPPAYRDARVAIGSGDYGAVVLTEMVELRDAIRYFSAAKYLRRWADLARKGNPETRIYLYETWHPLDDPAGWLRRIDDDLEQLWLGKLLGSDSRRDPRRPVYLIPAGQVMAAVARAAEAGDIDGLTSRENLFARTPSGQQDMIHFNDLGAYVVALTHYAVLYHRSPAGLPHQLTRADGSAATPLSTKAAQQLQALTWQVVTALPRTGVSR